MYRHNWATAVGPATFAGLFIFTLSGCSDAPAANETSASIPVEAVTVGGQSGKPDAPIARFSATVHRDREADLSFRVSGTLRTLPVRIGQRLPAGTLVAALDATAYDAASARAAADTARLGRAADRYAKLVPEGAVAEAQAKDARDALAGARASLAAARYDAASSRLAMPFTGVVLARNSEIGETVNAGQAVVRVADLNSPLLATAQVPAAYAARLGKGMAAQLIVEGHPPIPARVLRISGASDMQSGTVAVDLALQTPPPLASGTAASALFQLPAADAANGYLIPAEALLEAQGKQASVYVIDASGKARRRSVQFLGFDDRSARVSGLQKGARVITAGAGFVHEGDKVEQVAQ